MPKNQKLLIIVLAVILVIAGGFYLYSFIRQKQAPKIEDVALTSEERKKLTLTDEEKKKGTTLEQKEKQVAESKKADVLRELLGQKQKNPEIKVVAINKIVDKPIKFPVLSADGKKILYFDPEAHEFYQTELDGRASAAITRGNFVNLQDVSWSGDRSKAVISIAKGNLPTPLETDKTKEYFYFDFVAQASQKIDAHFQNIAVSPDSKKIAYIYTEADKNIFNLSVADPDGSNWRKIAFLDKGEGRLLWIDSNKTVFYHAPAASRQGSLYVYDVTEGKDSFIFSSGKYGFSARFSLDGKGIIWNEGPKGVHQPALYTGELAQSKSGNKASIDGLAEKCAWFFDNENILCGVPENFSQYYFQPNDWASGKFVSRDSFYKINAKTNELTRIAEAKQFDKDYDIADSFMTQDGKGMYFIRKHDGKLYELVMP